MTSISAIVEANSRARAIFLDDKPDTVAELAQIAEELSMTAVVVSTPLALLNVMRERRPGDRLYADMHMPEIRNFADVGLRDMSTQQGAAVGIGVIRGFLPHFDFTDTPTRILTIHPFAEEWRLELQEASDEGMDVGYLKKDNVDQFRSDLVNAIDPEHNKYKKKVAAVVKILESWAKTPDDTGKIPGAFGYVGLRSDDWIVLSKEILRFRQSDLEKRLDAILYIKVGLTQFFGDEASAEREADWLHEPDELMLAGGTPWDAINSGEIQSLMTVVTMVHRIS